MNAFTRILAPGTVTRGRRTLPAFVKVEWDGSQLSLTGVVDPRRNGDADSCGQIIDTLSEIKSPGDGWTLDTIAELARMWKRWHLNDLRPGTPKQEAFLRDHPVSFTHPETHYEAARTALRSAGIDPAPDALTADHKPYHYGDAWLYEEVPADVLAWFAALHESAVKPAWC